MARRIRMKEDAAPEPIIDPDGNNLGTMLPGLGYWVTPQNEAICRKVIEDGRAVEESEMDAPLNQVQIGALEGQVSGSVRIEDIT